MNQVGLLARLVENAIDFLGHSIREFETQPKYSVIHFHAAVELFLKARLLAEHWSLVVSIRRQPDWDGFVAGNFLSVSLGEAATKLDKVVRSGLTKQELEAFRRVTKHRNKMVHFFHEGVPGEEDGELRRGIAKEQLTAWYLLHQLLTSKWSDVFSKWSGKLREIDGRLRRLHEFLQVVFDQVTPEIERRRAGGSVFRDCPSCGFASQELAGEIGELCKAECLVCGLAGKCLMIECAECGTPVRFVNEGFGECGSCGRSFEPEDVVGALMDEGAAYVATKEGDELWDPGNCSVCDGYQTVVRLNDDGDRHICASCFGEFDSLHRCDVCNELNTDDMTDSVWFGCNVCDGISGLVRKGATE